MPFLKRGKLLVIDTHVLTKAATQFRDGTEDIELQFLKQVIEACARVAITPTQIHSSDERGELIERLRKEGFLSIYRSELMLQLATHSDGSKLRRVRKSATKAFSPQIARSFSAAGHRNVRDDMHLFETAAVIGGVLVTGDENILNRASQLRGLTGVEIVSIVAALEPRA